MADQFNESEEFGWVARFRPEPGAPVPVVDQMSDGGITIAHRRALVSTIAGVLLMAVVLSVAAGLRVGGGLGGEVAGSAATQPSLRSDGTGRIASTAVSTTVALTTPTSSASSTALSTVSSSVAPTSTSSTTASSALAGSDPTASSASVDSSRTALTAPTEADVAARPAAVGATPGTRTPTTRRPSAGRAPTTAAAKTATSSRTATSTRAAASAPTATTKRPAKTANTNPVKAKPAAATTSVAPAPAAPKKPVPATTTSTTTTTNTTTTTTTTTANVSRPPAGLGNGGIGWTRPGQLTVTDVVLDERGRPVPGVGVDLFGVGPDGRRAGYVATGSTDSSGRYTVTAPLAGPGVDSGTVDDPSDDCLIAVFVAPDGRRLEETGRYRETLICPREPAAVLPQVRVSAVTAGSDALSTRSVLASGGRFYLRGAVNDGAEAAGLARRYQQSISSDLVVVGYESTPGLRSSAQASGGSQTKSGSKQERVSIDGVIEPAFAPGAVALGDTALLVTRQVATVLKWNPDAKVRIVLAADPALDETPTAALLKKREAAVQRALGGTVGADRIEFDLQVDATTDGRRIGGRAISGQLEFVLLWP